MKRKWHCGYQRKPYWYIGREWYDGTWRYAIQLGRVWVEVDGPEWSDVLKGIVAVIVAVVCFWGWHDLIAWLLNGLFNDNWNR
jgi:hypothetical protein